MPKKTFFSLPEKKRNMVVEAAKKEFSRVPLANALVSNIIIDAKIPRGSFYQYFEDIEDCFYYIVDEYSKEIKTKLISNISLFEGDIIKSYHGLFLYILDMIEEKKNKNYFENLFLNMNHRVQKMFTPNFNEGLNNIINMVDVDKLNIQGRHQIGYVLDIIESLMIHNIVENYNRQIPKEKKIEIFERELILISKGIIKQ